jgi:hypothetical protein
MATTDFALRRSTQPYQALVLIFGCVTILAAFTALQQRDWTIIGVMPFGWLFLVPIIYIGTRYRLYWRGGAIIQRASGLDDVSIRSDEITRVVLERSDLQTLVSYRRPFRRIAIYAEHRDGVKFIDVSLKHFVADDIRKLMRAIHEQRPDLSLPKAWI